MKGALATVSPVAISKPSSSDSHKRTKGNNVKLFSFLIKRHKYVLGCTHMLLQVPTHTQRKIYKFQQEWTKRSSLVGCATLPKSQDVATKNNTVTIVPISILSLLGNRNTNFWEILTTSYKGCLSQVCMGMRTAPKLNVKQQDAAKACHLLQKWCPSHCWHESYFPFLLKECRGLNNHLDSEMQSHQDHRGLSIPSFLFWSTRALPGKWVLYHWAISPEFSLRFESESLLSFPHCPWNDQLPASDSQIMTIRSLESPHPALEVSSQACNT